MEGKILNKLTPLRCELSLSNLIGQSSNYFVVFLMDSPVKPGNDKKGNSYYIKLLILALALFFDSNLYAKDVTKPKEVKGVFVSAWIAGSDELFGKIVNLVNRTELNAVVIDCKDETGYVSWDSSVELARKSGASLPMPRVKDIHKVLAICKENKIYPITRIVAFNDPVLSKYRPGIAVQNRAGGVWIGKKGHSFLDPYSKEVWRYNVDLAKEAAKLGFKEVQFDYLRFPSDGNIKECVYPNKDKRSQVEVISGFLAFARKELASYKVVLSVDKLGQTGLAKDDMGIGQVIEEIAKNVDCISPMVYPSHYRKGVYGASDPDREPYTIVFASLRDMKERIKGTGVSIRPWLQDFTLKSPYGKKEVLAQIKACYDQGIREWLLWDPKCTFTEEALQKE